LRLSASRNLVGNLYYRLGFARYVMRLLAQAHAVVGLLAASIA
jgi:hypothetical protein